MTCKEKVIYASFRKPDGFFAFLDLWCWLYLCVSEFNIISLQSCNILLNYALSQFIMLHLLQITFKLTKHVFVEYLMYIDLEILSLYL